MNQDHIKKEALFNEVKGSLFEYLLAKNLSQKAGREAEFQNTLDPNYLTVLSQQDRMVRQFYPEMLIFLRESSLAATEAIVSWCREVPSQTRLTGKFSNMVTDWHEADLLLETSKGPLPLSIKLNKKNSYVNTKSGGIKSFFGQYFPFLPADHQLKFNQLVDMEFNRMAVELHQLHDLEYSGNFHNWVSQGLSELPGELEEEDRLVLRQYYSRIAREMHGILEKAATLNPRSFKQCLAPLMGYSSQEIVQLICFHDFKVNSKVSLHIHSYQDLVGSLDAAQMKPFGDISSVEIEVGEWSLQIRVKPMNKFTTTAIKINCSIRER